MEQDSHLSQPGAQCGMVPTHDDGHCSSGSGGFSLVSRMSCTRAEEGRAMSSKLVSMPSSLMGIRFKSISDHLPSAVAIFWKVSLFGWCSHPEQLRLMHGCHYSLVSPHCPCSQYVHIDAATVTLPTHWSVELQTKVRGDFTNMVSRCEVGTPMERS